VNPLALGFRQGAARLLASGGATLVLLAAGILSAAVASLGTERGRTAADLALISAAFGVALPLLSFFAAELVLAGQRLDRALRVLTRHGISGRNAGAGLALALAAASAAVALTVTICSLLAAYPASDPRLWAELAQTIPIATLAGVAYAGWYTLASSFGANGGGRKWLLVLDWVFGASSGWLALPFPRGHLRNLLGGAPVAEMSQGWAFGVLVVGTGLALAIGLFRSAD
jgi:hypothetical protein